LNTEDNIKVDSKEIGCEGVNWIQLAQNGFQWWALANMVMNLQVHKKWGIFSPAE
jgi:hypothetical protein